MNSKTITAIACTALLLTGCVSFEMEKPAPTQQEPIGINFTDEPVYSRLSLPTNIYAVPNSKALISGSQTSNSGLWLAFGAAGALAKTAVESHATKSESESIIPPLQVDLKTEATKVKNQLVTTDIFKNKFSTSHQANQPLLNVASAVVFSFDNETDARIYLVLKADLQSPTPSTPVWSTRYIFSSEPRPVSGPNSWSENNGKAIQEEINYGLEKSVKFMMNDISTPYTRNSSNLNVVQGQFLFVPIRAQILGHKLNEDSESISFIPKHGDGALFAGVNIISKKDITFRPAKENDPIFMPIQQLQKN